MKDLPVRIRTIASEYQCEDCPPERVCAWGCIQGAGVEEIIIGAALALEGTSWSLQMPVNEAEDISAPLMMTYT